MIGSDQLEIGLFSGFLLIVFGLVPGVLNDIAVAVWNLGAMLMNEAPSPVAPEGQSTPPVWVACSGVALMAVTVVAYLVRA